MFEKEADEYLKAQCQKRKEEFVIRMPEVYIADIPRAYKDGAEFGYNKANEWHKQDIDDIYDCIAEDWSVRYFICIMKDKSKVTAMGNCDEGYEGDVSVNLFFDHDDAKYLMDDIVWWKEITLPQESE